MRAPTISRPESRGVASFRVGLPLCAALSLGSALSAGAALSCGTEPVPVTPAQPTASVAPEPVGDPVSFELVDTDGKPISAESLRGRITLVLFITTYDVESQAMVQFVAQLLHEHAPRLNAVALVLEIEKNRLLAEAFARALEPGYPVALAGETWIRGDGAFPGLKSVPSLAVLDRTGREAARFSGFMRKPQIEALVREVESRE
jgi:hypothetical protein